MKYFIDNSSKNDLFPSMGKYLIICIFSFLCLIGENYSFLFLSISFSFGSAIFIYALNDNFIVKNKKKVFYYFLNILSFISVGYILFFIYDINHISLVSCGNGCIASRFYGTHVLTLSVSSSLN